MQNQHPVEPFWSDIQTLLDRSHDVTRQRENQRACALQMTASALAADLDRILKQLDIHTLVARCTRSNPSLPTDRVDDLLNANQWQWHEGCYLRAFFVLSRMRGDRRGLALATAPSWTPGCMDWHGDEGQFRGFIPTVLLELVDPDRDSHQVTGGRRYTLFLHPDRIRIAGSDVVWSEPQLEQRLRPLRDISIAIGRLSQLNRPALSPLTLPSADTLRVQWQSLALPAAQQEALARLQARLLVNEPGAPRAVLLSGPTGVGKSLAIDVLATSAAAQTIDLDALLDRHDLAKTAVEQIEQQWSRPETRSEGGADSTPRILVIEDCERWFGITADGRSDSNVSAAVLRGFLRAWEQGIATRDQPIRDPDGDNDGSAPPRVLLVATTRHPERLDPAVRARFDLHIDIGLPGAIAREQMLRAALHAIPNDAYCWPEECPNDADATSGASASSAANDGLTVPAATLQALVSASHGLSGRELIAAVKQQVAERTASPAQHASCLLMTLQRRRQQANPTVDANAHWDRLVLPEVTRETLKDLVFQLEAAPALRKAGFKPATAVLLYGPPGTGKTQSARTLANESGLAFIAASTAELKAEFIGQSGQRVRQVFATARERAPAILFLDEIDAVATDRGSGSTDSFNREVVTQLLQELDGIRDHSSQPVLVIAATNCMETLDPALLSRFREKVLMDLPTPDERLQLLEILLATLTVEPDARGLMRDWVRSGEIDGAAAGSTRCPAEPPRSHRDVEQWVNRVLALSIRRWRITRSEHAVLVDTASLTQTLRVTSADVLASLGIQATGFATSSQRDGIDGKPWRAAA